MGRPQQVGLMYFPIDTNFFFNKKVKSLRRAHCSIGIAVYLNILCRVYSNGYYYRFDDYDELVKDIAEDIVGEREQIRQIAARVSETLHYMLEVGLIERSLFEMNVISSRAIQEQFAESVRKAKRNTKIDSYNLVGVNVVAPENRVSSEEMGVSSEEMGVSSEESAQSKVNENKVCTHSTAPGRGSKKNVVLTDDQYRAICKEIPDADAYIDRFSERIAEKGYRYDDHYKAIMSWWAQDKGKAQGKGRKTGKKGGSFDVDDFFEAAVNRTYQDM